MSAARQAVHLADSFTGLGKRPDFTPSHQQVLPRGITLNTCGRRKNPVSGISCISRVSLFNHPHLFCRISYFTRVVAMKMALKAGLRAFVCLAILAFSGNLSLIRLSKSGPKRAPPH